ncbi:hypothetical protein ACSBR1_010244 [Camellia fascicularis]
MVHCDLIVWKAGGDSGDADSCASFQFLSNDNLHLVNSSDTVVWQSNIAGRGVSSVALDDSVQFSYKELQRAIEGFKEKLGAGGFGAVYRGFLANKTVVAVKQLEGIK